MGIEPFVHKGNQESPEGVGIGQKSEEIRSLSNERDVQLGLFAVCCPQVIQWEKSNEALELIDTGGKGVVVVEDLARVAKELEEDLTAEELVEMMEFVDRSGDEMLSRKDFARIARKVNL